MTIFAAILVFAVIVVVHEFGHFIVAKLSGIKVEEFAVGMGPKIVGLKKGDTLYSIRALPLGGFCKLTGEDENSNDISAFSNKPVLNRILVVLFGPIMNLLLSILIFSLVIVQVPIIGETIENMPAQKSGIVKGDKIIEIDGRTINTWDEVTQIISKSENKSLSIKVINKGNIREIQVTPIKDLQNEGAKIGIRPTARISGISLVEGVKITFTAAYTMIGYLGQLLFGKASTNEIVGPVGIIIYLNEAAKSGFLQVLYFTAILSLNLGIINILPLPALDGGRLVFLIIEAVTKRRVNPEKEGLVHFIGFVLLMVLSLAIAYKDVIKFNIFNLGR